MNVYVLQLAREFAARGYRVDVFTRHHDPRDPRIVELEDGARVVHLDAGPYDAAKQDLFNYIPRFISELREFQRSERLAYDIIHSHYWLSGRVGMTLSADWRVPHVTTFHTLAKTDAPPHKVKVIPAGVNLDMFSPVEQRDARRKLGIREENVILYVGRIEPLKGIDILLRAVPLLECANDLRVMVVGGNPSGDTEMERLKAISAELGISDSVTFTGPVPQDRLPAYYSAADIYVLPSHAESFGLAALEAMACGTPVVVSRVGGLKTFVENGKTGYLAPWRCPDAFAQRLDMLLAAPDLRRAMGRAAREKALSMGWNRVADRMLDYYAGLSPDAWPALTGN